MNEKSPPLAPELALEVDAHWRAANYPSAGQIYLYDNPLLKKPLTRKHIKPRLLGHWGTTPGLNFIYVHLNRAIRERDSDRNDVRRHGRNQVGVIITHATWDPEGFRSVRRYAAPAVLVRRAPPRVIARTEPRSSLRRGASCVFSQIARLQGLHRLRRRCKLK